MTIYKFFSDPLWQSIGVILSALGVFWGAKLGIRSTQKLNKENAENDAKLKFEIYKSEVLFNFETFSQFSAFMPSLKSKKVYSELDFESIEVGSRHVRRGAWEEFLKTDATYIISKELLDVCLKLEYNINVALRSIQMDIADWKRFDTEEGSPESKYKEIRSNIELKTKTVLSHIENFKALL